MVTGLRRAGVRRSAPVRSERGETNGLVERLVLDRGHLGVPVPAAGERLVAPLRPPPGLVRGDEQRVEDVGRRHVEEDVREVLAADQVDVVDPQVDGRHLVTGGAARPLPLHDRGQPAAQPVGGRQEGLPVGPGRVELGVVGAAGAQLGQALPHLGRQAVHDRRARAHRRVDVGQAEHAEPGAELGHRGAVARHARILPRPRRGAGVSAAGARGPDGRPVAYSVNRGVSCSSSGPTAASAARCSSVLS